MREFLSHLCTHFFLVDVLNFICNKRQFSSYESAKKPASPQIKQLSSLRSKEIGRILSSDGSWESEIFRIETSKMRENFTSLLTIEVMSFLICGNARFIYCFCFIFNAFFKLLSQYKQNAMYHKSYGKQSEQNTPKHKILSSLEKIALVMIDDCTHKQTHTHTSIQ